MICVCRRCGEVGPSYVEGDAASEERADDWAAGHWSQQHPDDDRSRGLALHFHQR